MNEESNIKQPKLYGKRLPLGFIKISKLIFKGRHVLQVTIPAQYARQFDLKENDVIQWIPSFSNNQLILRKDKYTYNEWITKIVYKQKKIKGKRELRKEESDRVLAEMRKIYEAVKNGEDLEWPSRNTPK